MDQAEGLRQLVASRGARGPRVVAVTSGKGGVGKTHLAANMAVAAARGGQRVLIIDGDLGLANVEILFGLSPRRHVGHVVEGASSIEQVLVQGPLGIRLLPAGSGIQALTHLTDEQKLRLTSALDAVAEGFDLVLIDSGAGIGNNVLFFVGAAQQAILVVSPEPTSLTDAYAAVKALSLQADVPVFDVVVNGAANETRAREVYQRLCAVCARFLDARLRYLGWVPTDENVGRAVMAQKPLIDLFPLSPASRAYRALTEKLLSDPAPECGGGLRMLWNRLLGGSPEEVPAHAALRTVR